MNKDLDKYFSDFICKENTAFEILNSYLTKIDQAKKLIFFGAGIGGAKTYTWIIDNIKDSCSKVSCFLDNNEAKWNSEFFGKRVLSPVEVLSNYSNELIVISCGEGDVIKKQIMKFEIDEENIIIPDISLLDTVDGEFDYIWSNIDNLRDVHEMLEDEKSKLVFRNILNYKISHDINLIKSIYDSFEQQYFDKELIIFKKDDIFLDCGGYIGDTVASYIKHNKGMFSKIISIEADNNNFQILSEYIKNRKLENIFCYNMAVWNKKCSLNFDNIGSGSGFISKDGEIEVEAETIDNILNGEKCSIIKMDIEGAEYDALIGASETIKEYKPYLAISVYHKQDDILKIPLLIKSLNPEYKIFLRHYRELSVQETVCYGIPK